METPWMEKIIRWGNIFGSLHESPFHLAIFKIFWCLFNVMETTPLSRDGGPTWTETSPWMETSPATDIHCWPLQWSVCILLECLLTDFILFVVLADNPRINNQKHVKQIHLNLKLKLKRSLHKLSTIQECQCCQLLWCIISGKLVRFL